MDACEQGVALEPEDGEYRRSRGLARALTGDTGGAIEDFEAYVKWPESDWGRKQVQGWIDALRAGEDPFTEEVLKELR